MTSKIEGISAETVSHIADIIEHAIYKEDEVGSGDTPSISLAAARALLASGEVVLNPWQPIETIPRDSEWVRLKNTKGQIDEGQWCDAEGFQFQDQLNTLHGFGDYTHWTPKIMGEVVLRKDAIKLMASMIAVNQARHSDNGCCRIVPDSTDKAITAMEKHLHGAYFESEADEALAKFTTKPSEA